MKTRFQILAGDIKKVGNHF